MEDLIYFLSRSSNNAWIYCDRYTIYVRKTMHYVKDLGLVRTFDIANINLIEGLRGRGGFTLLLEHIEEVLKIHETQIPYIYVESIMNDRLYAYLVRHGFKLAGHEDMAINLYRPIGDRNG